VRKSIENIVGYKVNTIAGPLCVADIAEQVKRENQEQSCRWLACLNPHSVVMAQDDQFFSRALYSADWLIPDGIGIVLASKILGGKIRQRVTGSDIFSGVSEALNAVGGRSYFFLGSTENTLSAIKEKLAWEFPNISFAGCYSPPFISEFCEEENREMVEAINSVAPDVLWVGMTAPKQEKWIHQHRDQLNVKFIGAIGAVFDFYVGNVKRSHPVFQRIGLEWLPRLLQEPWRLFRRNFVSSPLFLWRVLRQRFKQ
jgi:N-acetylglucosaminyldiphosphoundecaprenol N-acetyl-beta-D-mannosaminyltransferase